LSQKFLTPIDLALNELQNAVIQNLASNPSGVAGRIYYNTVTGAFEVYNGITTAWVALGTGSGTVTAISVASSNGFTGSSSGGSTPAITLATSISGLLKGSASAIVAATSGTDYAPATSGSSALKASAGGFANAVLNDVGAATADYSLNTHKITSLLDPSAAQDAATKNYVDGVAQGLSGKYSAVAATLGSETYTISAGSVTVISGTTLDGQSPAVNDYVLVKDAPAASGTGSAASTQPGNGLYLVTSATTNLSLSRAADMSGTNGPDGSFVFVEGGTQASSGWAVSVPSTSAAFTYGTNNIKFTQFSGAGEITPGAGLAKSGNTLSIENSGVLTVAHGGSGAATLTGLVKGNGTSAFTAATPGTDYTRKFTATIGDGSSTSITVTHSLGTKAVTWSIQDASTNVFYGCDFAAATTTTATLGFTTAPALNSLIVTIIG